jgi:cytoskeletal protein CcmA (bactofilin family)
MSLFSRRETSPLPNTNFSVLDSHITVTGDLETDGALRVDGRIEGTILRADLLVIGEGASIVGDVNAREVIVGGAVTGNIYAVQRTELLSSGIVAGDIRSAAILIQEGGVVQGRLYIHPISGEGSGPTIQSLPARTSGDRTSGETEGAPMSPALERAAG